jgi:hypothetical protein
MFVFLTRLFNQGVDGRDMLRGDQSSRINVMAGMSRRFCAGTLQLSKGRINYLRL